MDAAEAFHEQLEAKRAALTPNQLKKQRKKRAKLFKQVAEPGSAQTQHQPAQSNMDSEREGSVASQPEHSTQDVKARKQQTVSSCEITASNASATDASIEQAHKRRKCMFKQPLKLLRPRHSSQADAPRQTSDLSAALRALQHRTVSASEEQHECRQQEVSSPNETAEATASHCSETSGQVSTCLHAAVVVASSQQGNSSRDNGPCRVDLSGQLAVINQQLTSDHSSSSDFVDRRNNKQGHQTEAACSQGPHQQQQADGQQPMSRKRQRPSCLYGNYHHYYGYRIGPSGFEDPRMQVLDPEWFRGADVLDIGCNEGLLTLALAVGFGTRSMLGVDIDPGLVAKACTNLSRSRTQLTQQFRGAVASRDAKAGRLTASLPYSTTQQAPDAAAADGPLSIITASSAAAGSKASSSNTSSVHYAIENTAAVAHSSASSVGTTNNLPGRSQLEQFQDSSTTGQQQQTVSQPVNHQQHQLWQRQQHPQQHHQSLQGRVVQLDRQLKALSRVSFKCGNWLDIGCAANKYGVVTCFSVTKWIHLNWGDDGVMKLFHKFHRCLVPGGMLVLEPQPFRSYQNAVHKAGVQAAPFKKINELKLKPESFCEFLTQRVGFELVQQLHAVSQVAGEEAVPVKGFDRPILVMRKPRLHH